ncbi:hypothetical protein J31TS4_34120 [Paenibacillus sp. J31TS4]|uniref:metallophosphoesterase family protein n=1 Tax=Paenibacillus sp. J31TS4 TaxID=2807195 RepID=UPI001B181BF4|nr:metallophosphoesterase [Paenibacillus sp. J31TS4]GIP40132.1 hypothetical protein J31TS4_34120 [Paenibacillus sp. J31TS4]
MTRFLFITDTHIGASPVGFQRQPAYPERGEALLAELRDVIEHERIDFVLHGGDLIDKCTPEQIREARRLLDYPVPVHLSIGNHDLDRPDAAQLWLAEAPDLFADGSLQYTVRYPDFILHVVPNQWEPGVPYFWRTKQEPFFLEEQLPRLEEELRREPNAVHLLAIHNPLFGVPMEQSGLDRIVHEIAPRFRETVLDVVRRYPQVKAVFSGHNHINTLLRTKEGVFLSGSSFVETPFEYKLVEVTKSGMRIETRRLDADRLAFTPEYDEKVAFVQGREQDRSIELTFGE